MKNAPTSKASESAVEQRHFTTAATAPRTDLKRAVEDIRAAVAALARLATRATVSKGGEQ